MLAGLALSESEGVYRVRVTLAHDGQWKMTSALLPAAEEPTRYLVIADEVLDAEDYLLRHKTTARDRYDRALAAMAGREVLMLFFNTRGELCEGAQQRIHRTRWQITDAAAGVRSVARRDAPAFAGIGPCCGMRLDSRRCT